MLLSKSLIISSFKPSPICRGAEKGYHAELDGLRGVSILLVFISHYGLTFLPGGFGVNVFFFVSGFLITRLLEIELRVAGVVNLKAFYARRMLRLAPALLVFVLFFSSLWFYLFAEFSLNSVFAAIFYYFNYFRLYSDSYFTPFGALWSLAIEEHFYIFYPALFILLNGASQKMFRFLLSLIVLVLIWRFTLMYLISNGLVDIEMIHFKKSTDTRIDSIAFGALLAVMSNQVSLLDVLNKFGGVKSFYFGLIMIVTGLMFKIPLIESLLNDSTLRYTLRYFLTGSGLFFVLNYILFHQDASLIRSLLSGKIIVYFGKISYSLYLWNMSILHTLRKVYPDANMFDINAVGAVLSIVASVLSYHYVEKSVLKYRRKWGSNVDRH